MPISYLFMWQVKVVTRIIHCLLVPFLMKCEVDIICKSLVKKIMNKFKDIVVSVLENKLALEKLKFSLLFTVLLYDLYLLEVLWFPCWYKGCFTWKDQASVYVLLL